MSEARIMGKVTRVGDLFDFYASLLTERQRSMVQLYYLDDWSLSEIAEHLGVSRQAVHDNLRRSEEQMESYEGRLQLVAMHARARSLLQDIETEWSSASEWLPPENRQRIRNLLNDLASVFQS